MFVFAIIIILFGPIHINLKASSIFASLITVVVITNRSLDNLPNFLIAKLEWLGDRSYSVYLVHMPLIYVAKYSPVAKIGNNENRLIQTVIAVAASMFLGSVSYSKIENRFRGIGKHNTNSLKSIVVPIIATFLIPFILFLTINQAVKEQYWGLYKSLLQPTVAWELDSSCNRMSVLEAPCAYEVLESQHTVLLIGDSRAAMYSQAVIESAKKMNWNVMVWTLGGCNVQFHRTIKNQATDICMYQNHEILDWVKINKPNSVIISQFVRYNSPQKDLKDALLTLTSLVPSILLIENTPVFPKNSFNRAVISMILKSNLTEVIPESTMNSQNKIASDHLANWARNNNIHTVNFDSLICQNMFCYMKLDERWLYYDDSHFSVAGAALTIPLFEAFFKTALIQP